MFKKLKKKLIKSISDIFSELRRRAQNNLFTFTVFNLFIVAGQLGYILLRKSYLSSDIPFWYTKTWGSFQFAPKSFIFLIPLTSLLILVGGLILIMLLNRFFLRYIVEFLTFFVTFSNLILLFQIFRIVQVSSSPFTPLLDPFFMELLLPFLLAFFCVYLFTPVFINFARSHNIITNPGIHNHPAMILKSPSARGGGVVYSVVFLVLSVLFAGINLKFSGLYLAILLLGILGFVDDYQNTHPHSSFRILENPVLRLILLTSVATLIPLSGLKINIMSNPFGQIIDLNMLQINLFGGVVSLVPSILTVLWIVWVMNLLSWSNGIDGQFSGIVGIVSLFLVILSLRFTPMIPIHKSIAMMAVISAGASFGFVRYTWHPSKIMWGFGAMSAGLVLATLAIFAQTKILISILMILVPFFDAVVTIIRRLFQKKNPFRGDRGHLHHLLLTNGWSVKKIALFYWVTTAVFGIIGILSSEKYIVQTTMILGGVVAFFIILMNITSNKKRTS